MNTQPIPDRGRTAIAAILALLLVLAGAITATPAFAVEGASVTGTVTAASPTGITVGIEASGLGEVTAAYATVIVKGTEAQLSPSSPAIEAHATDGSLSGALELPASGLDRTQQYEVILWQTRSLPSAATIYARADVSISPVQWEAVFPPTATATILTVSPETTAVEGAPVTLTATISPDAAGTVVFRADATDLGSSPVASGTATLATSSLPVGSSSLTAEFTPTDASTHAASTSEAVSYTVTEKPADPQPAVPTVTVSKTSGLDAAGETITVRGSGFAADPPATTATRPPLAGRFGGAYIVFGKFLDTWEPSVGAPSSARKVLVQKWGVGAADVAAVGGASAGAIAIAADGTFETTLTVSKTEASELLSGNYGIYTYPGSGAVYAPFETYTPIAFAEPAPVPSLSVSKTTGLDRDGETLTITVENYDATAASKYTAGKAGFYLQVGWTADAWRPSDGAPSAARTNAYSTWVADEANTSAPTKWVDNGDGTADASWQVTITKAALDAKALTGGTLAVFTVGAGGVVQAMNELAVPIAFSAPDPVRAIEVTVTDASASAGATLKVTGSGFGDVTGAYAAIIEKGTESAVTAAGGYVAFGYWAGAIVDGQLDRTLVAPVDKLDPAKQYEVIVWQLHTNPDAGTIHARADVPLTADQWRAIFPPVTAPTDPTDPTDPVTPPAAVAGGSLRWAISTSFSNYVTGDIAHGSIAVGGGATRANGSFQFGQAAGSTYDPATGLGTVTYTGSVRFTGHNGALDVTIANPQVRLTSAATGSLWVTSGGSQVNFATLNLAAAAVLTSSGATTYSNVPATLTAAGRDQVLGGFSTELDAVTFTIGSPAAAPTGSIGTVASAPRPAAPPVIPSTAPATTGIDAAPDQLAALAAGLVATVSASGFQPDESDIQIVVYSTPIVLGTAKADASGTVTWTGSVPATLEDGEHTLTFQGSVDRGIRFTLARAAALAAASCVVDGARLDWGFKESFRAYIEGIAAGGWELDGVEYVYPEYVWTGGTGSVDDGTRTGLVTYGGSIRFTGHDGALDTTLSHARVELAGSTGYLVFDVTGTTQAGQAVQSAGVRFAEFALPDLEATGEGIVLDALPATLTAAGATAFGTYPAGEELDAVSAVLPLGDACDTLATVADEPTAEAAETEAVTAISAVAPGAPAWPWIAGGAVLLAAIGAAAWIVVARRRRAVVTAGDDRSAE
ncbi:HtaA domain-containing protein [Microbacterium sp. BWT-B31]|uniref:HtaA domain-containing protein n=1 Tax=Microbacterium sp. BWT-B31 TaxID=3232072 RepID=UPI0035286B47